LALYDATGRLLATAGSAEFPSRLPAERARHWRRGKVRIDLPDGRVALAVVRAPWSRARPLAWLAVLAVTAALIAWVVARRLARRLERLQAQVIALGEGDLSARVEVHGRDEIAELAHRFNDAAARIEALVGGQRAMLAAASHELRSPLARIRMALELLDTGKRRDLHARLEHDISELDALIGELLLASRLETGSESIVRESVDLLALAREEGARSGARVDGVNVLVQGDARLLRRAVRNLLENAKRHAPAESVELTIAADDGMARITVCDRGPGVPEAERERIFEPFYRSPGTAESGSGVGLGLWLVRRIARQHGGEASCAAREGDGACFTIALPLGG